MGEASFTAMSHESHGFCFCGERHCKGASDCDGECTSKFQEGTPERALADHLDSEGFGGWVNCDEIVDEVKRLGWSAPEPSDCSSTGSEL